MNRGHVSNTAINGQKRKRTRLETPPETSVTMGFMDKIAAMEDQFVNRLKNVQKQVMESKKSQGLLITCCAMYTFEKDIKDIQSLQMNNYGSGKLEQVRMVVTGEEMLPVPAWIESRVALQAYFERKLDSTRRHSSGAARKHGFEVPWRASVQLQSIPPGCFVESVQLSFINPASNGSPTIKMDQSAEGASNLYLINDTLMNIRGHTYSECCQELGIFRRGYCYITLRVPLRLLIREQLKQLRIALPHSEVGAALDDFAALNGNDNVALKFGRSNMKVDRQFLVSITPETRMIFGPKMAGHVSTYEMDVSKEAVVALLNVVKAATDYLPLDFDRTTPLFLYELMALASDWNIPSRKLRTQLALLERFCEPGFNLHSIPVDKLMQFIRRDYIANEAQTGVKMVLLGFMFALRDMLLPATMVEQFKKDFDQISMDPTLDDVFEPVGSLVSVVTDGVVKVECEYTTVPVILQDGNQLELRVLESANIEQVKAVLGRRLEVPIHQQIIVFDGRRLASDTLVSDIDFKDGDMLEMYFAQTGC
ncbi:uncharacterized protein LOC129599960 [Paramacrobiotus metropolitanus]|uniref:uncharacterized protein LOC129599960 n=1 Tax=Paramacrobiotus metropolitanus TaxID=2943436 RepID=UPI002446223D|nr:uncharacterized protein LOC129599960 [Paramacrobiotus metropolitanus]